MSWASVLRARNPGDGFAADSAGSEGGPPALPDSRLGSLGIFVIQASHSSHRHIESADTEGLGPRN